MKKNRYSKITQLCGFLGYDENLFFSILVRHNTHTHTHYYFELRFEKLDNDCIPPHRNQANSSSGVYTIFGQQLEIEFKENL